MAYVKKKPVRRPDLNTLAADPSQTGAIRRAWMAQMESKIAELQRRVRTTIDRGSLLDAVPVANANPYHDDNGRFSFSPDPRHLHDAMSKVEFGAVTHGSLVSLKHLRAQMPHLSKPEFDVAMAMAMQSGHVYGHRTDLKASSLSEDDKKNYLGLDGSWYVGVAVHRDYRPGGSKHRPVTNAWSFRNTDAQLKMFHDWLQVQMQDLFYPQDEDSWWREYVTKGWAQGAKRVYDAWKSPSEFLRQSFNLPVGVERVKSLASRVLIELKGLTQDMATRMSRSLVDGMTQGKSPREVAVDIAKSIDGVPKKRALTIARTETVRAHAEGQLNTLEQLGMQQVSVAVEWSVSGMGVTRKGNPSPCEVCAPLNGVVFTLQEAHGLIPRHPNCMCSFVPANVGEDQKGQIRSYRGISAALRKSIKAQLPKKSKKTLAQQLKKVNWEGLKAKIDKKRPKSIISNAIDAAFEAKHKRDAHGRFASMDSQGFPTDISKLTTVKKLGGSTGALLVKDQHGNLFVHKTGKSSDQIHAEFSAERAYKAAGVPVNDSKLYETPHGPVKLSKFVEGKMLNEYSQSEQATFKSQIQKHFAMDALMANWDVVGLSKDNLLVDKHGVVHRIDVGGSLDYRAQGGSKGTAWNGSLTELDSMRTLAKNSSAKWAFGDMTEHELRASMRDALQHRDQVLAVLPEKYHHVVSQRYSVLKARLENGKKPTQITTSPPQAVLSPSQPGSHLGSAQSLVSHYHANAKGMKFNEDQIKKLIHLNPNGLTNGTVYLPVTGTSLKSPSNAHHIEQMSKILPPGTKLKMKIVSMKSIESTPVASPAVAKPAPATKKSSESPPPSPPPAPAPVVKTHLLPHEITNQMTLTDMQIGKFKFLNPEGVKLSGGTCYMPVTGQTAKDVSNQKNIEKLQKILPEGTKIKLVIVASKYVNNPDFTTIGGKIVSVSKSVPKPVTPFVTPGTTSFVSDPNLLPKDHVKEKKEWPITAAGATWQPPKPTHELTLDKHIHGLMVSEPSIPLEKREQLDQWKSGLNMHERSAIGAWKGSSRAIRKAITQNPPPPPKIETDAKAYHFYKAIEKGIGFVGTVYRGVNNGGGGNYADTLAAHFNQVGIGGIWADTAPHCTSRNTRTAGNFSGGELIMEIKSKTARVIEHEDGHAGEQEITGMPNTQYRILAINKNVKVGEKKVKTHVVLEEI